MGQLTRRRTVCMAPSVELWQPEAKHMGHIAERMISRDYIFETRPDAFSHRQDPVSTIGDFFDVGDLEDYKTLLRNRHPLEVNRTVLAAGKFRIPDMSTWRGEYRERTSGISHPSGEKQGQRSEHYEIKPDNEGGTKKGQEKLDDITRNYRALELTHARLNPGYERGTWYPPEARRKVPGSHARRIAFTHVLAQAQALKHKIRRWEAILTKLVGGLVRVHKFWLDIVRRQPGLLQYKICFDLEMPDDCTDAFEDALAAKLVRLVYEHLLLGLSLEQQKRELQFVGALRTLRAQPLRPGPAQDPKVAEMLAALEQEAKFGVTFGKMIEELKPLREQIRQVLLTRNRGIPGEIFLICCDAAFLRQVVTNVRSRAFERNLQMLRGLYGPSTPDFLTGFTLARAGVLTAHRAANDIASGRLSADVSRWIEEHQTEIIVAVGVVIVLTAAVLVVVATAGAAAPLVVPLAETALVETAVLAGEEALITSAAASITVEGTAVTVGAASASGGAAAGWAAVGTGTGIGLAVDGAALTQGQVMALRFGIGMRHLAAGAAGATVLTPTVASAALSDDVLLTRPGTNAHTVAIQNLTNTVRIAALAAGGDEQQRSMLMRAFTPPEAVLKWRDAIVKAGTTVAALSSSQLITRGVTTNPNLATSSRTARETAVIEIGHLHLLRLRISKGGVPQLPALEQEFDCTTLSDEYDGRLHYVGFIRCG